MTPNDATPPFAQRLQELIRQRYGDIASFHRALEDAGVTVSEESCRKWVRGLALPRRRHAAAIDELLEADGELLELAGYHGASESVRERLNTIENELLDLHFRVSELAAAVEAMTLRLRRRGEPQ